MVHRSMMVWLIPCKNGPISLPFLCSVTLELPPSSRNRSSFQILSAKSWPCVTKVYDGTNNNSIPSQDMVRVYVL